MTLTFDIKEQKLLASVDWSADPFHTLTPLWLPGHCFHVLMDQKREQARQAT